MARPTKFAGTFYEKNQGPLQKQIENCFLHEKGPGDLPMKRGTKPLKAIMVPHAGYQFSGPCAAWGYKALAEAAFTDLYIIIGPNHAGNGSFLSTELWDTPYGQVRMDRDFVKSLLEKNTQLKINEHAHAEEHSIEAQLPFLQFATMDKMHELKVVPIILDQDIDYKALSLDLKEAIVESGKSVTFIISSDLTHYGRNYHYVPFTADVEKNIKEMDQAMLELIKIFKDEELLQYYDEKSATVCGILPIVTLLKTIKQGPVELEQYYTSADITDGQYKNSVSYATLLFS